MVAAGNIDAAAIAVVSIVLESGDHMMFVPSVKQIDKALRQTSDEQASNNAMVFITPEQLFQSTHSPP